MTETKNLVPLHSKESEMLVLGSMLTSANALNICCKILREMDFFFTEHKLIFLSIQAIWQSKEVCDVHLTCERLKGQDKLKSVGGLSYITTLAQYAGTSVYIEEYINELKKYSSKRRLLDLASDLQKRALSDEEPKKIILATQEHLKLIEKSKGAKDKFPIRFLSEFDENFFLVEPKKKAMLLEYAKEDGKTSGFLPKGIVAMLVGAGGVGKTHFLAQLAVSIATGTPFLNTYTPTKHCGANNQGNVFFGLGENQYDDIHRLLFKATKNLRKNQPNLLEDNVLFSASKRIAAFSFCGQQAAFIDNSKPSLYFRELKMRLEDTAPLGGWTMLILDPVSRLMGADAEADNAAATQFIALLEELTMDLPGNPTVLFAHHTNKAATQQGTSQNQSAARGSSALTDGVRWQCNFTRDSATDVVVLKMTKSNFTSLIEEIKTKKDFDGFIEKCSTQFVEEKAKTSESRKKGSEYKTNYMVGLGIAGINDD